MNPLVFVLAFATFLSTAIGGIFAIKFRNVLHYFFAFAAGALVAVALLDLLPESLSTAQAIGMPIRYSLIAVVLSFLFYNLIEKIFSTHHIHDNDESSHGHIMGPIGAGSLVVHSFLDGAAIGAAFQVNAGVGLIVAFAVIAHDFTDGINTVTLMLKNRHTVSRAAIFLLADAIAPILGVFATFALVLDQTVLTLVLAVFVGEFIYIGASNMLPETRKHTPWKMMVLTSLGVFVILVLTSLI
ncbi:MAG: ZIP family metal transporter [Candidatus Micrarchaeota archaeon]|nr:ZIP family metal transporter [Candidatus Micrarchaeota archaeon]